MSSLATIDATNFVPPIIHGMSLEAQSEVPKHQSKHQLYQYTYEALSIAVKECGEDDWDGYDAKGMDRNSYEESVRFLDMLPGTTPAPEVAVDPDGMVAFEWHEEPRWVFSVSFETNGAIAYAGLFGNSKTHGTEYFGQALPQSILDSIRRVYSRNS